MQQNLCFIFGSHFKLRWLDFKTKGNHLPQLFIENAGKGKQKIAT
jgi:hypothetical protein